jgi:hypothetical protein
MKERELLFLFDFTTVTAELDNSVTRFSIINILAFIFAHKKSKT